MVPGQGIRSGVQQDTTRVAGVADTVVKKSGDTVATDTSGTRQGVLSLDNLEKLFQQTDRRLKEDSVAAAKVVRRAVRKKEVKKSLQDPSDSIFLMQVTSRPPGNTPREILSRTFSGEEMLSADSTRAYRPVQKRINAPVKRTVEVREVTPVAIRREPAFLRENWVLGVLILAFLLIIWTKIRFGKLLNQTLSALWNYKNAGALFRNKSSLYQWASVLLTTNFLLTVTLFFYFFLKTWHPALFDTGTSHIRIYLDILLLVAAVYFYFLAIVRITNFITLTGESLKEFGHFTKLFFHNAGLYLFPLTVIIPYVYEPVARSLLWAGLFLFLLFYLFRVVKLISIFIQERFSIFLMILYLCTLEILPVAILLKYLTG